MTLFQSIEDRMNAYYEKVYSGLPDGKKEQVLDSLNALIGAIEETKCF